jgi:hypothetical protein
MSNDLYSSKPLCREDLLMTKLKHFFNNKEYLKKLIDIVSGNSEISLRDIDWFVTNFSKKHNIIYNLEMENGDEVIQKQFIVFINYKSQLKAFGKYFFDPFCRNKRIQFNFEKNKSLVTTVGQLNFFKWAISNKIISYIEEHLSEIKKDMNLSTKHLKNSNKNETPRRKRTTLSVSAVRTVNKHDVSITVNFGDKQEKVKEENCKKITDIGSKISETIKNLTNKNENNNPDIHTYFQKYKNNILVNTINC